MQAFDFPKDYVLEDDRVLLRPLRAEDLEHLSHFGIEEPEIWRYSLVRAGGEGGMQRYIDLALTGRSKQREYPFIVFDKKTQQYAGSTRFYDIQIDNQTLQLGYTWYGKEFQGTGLNRHCKFLLLQFAFDELGMLRVEFRADNNNARSIAAMKAIGCTVEGVLRQNVPNPDGGRRDSIIFSILKSEWESHVKAMIRNKLD